MPLFAKKSKKGGDGEKRYDVKRGGKKLVLTVQADSIELTGGKASESYRYKDMMGWGAEGSSLEVELRDGKRLQLKCSKGDGDQISQAMTDRARKLAKSIRKQKSSDAASAAADLKDTADLGAEPDVVIAEPECESGSTQARKYRGKPSRANVKTQSMGLPPLPHVMAAHY